MAELLPPGQFAVQDLVEIFEGVQAGDRVDVRNPRDLAAQGPQGEKEGGEPGIGEKGLLRLRREEVGVGGIHEEDAERLPLEPARSRVQTPVRVFQTERGILDPFVPARDGHRPLAGRHDDGKDLLRVHLLDEFAREAAMGEDGQLLRLGIHRDRDGRRSGDSCP